MATNGFQSLFERRIIRSKRAYFRSNNYRTDFSRPYKYIRTAARLYDIRPLLRRAHSADLVRYFPGVINRGVVGPPIVDRQEIAVDGRYERNKRRISSNRSSEFSYCSGRRRSLIRRVDHQADGLLTWPVRRYGRGLRVDDAGGRGQGIKGAEG